MKDNSQSSTFRRVKLIYLRISSALSLRLFYNILITSILSGSGRIDTISPNIRFTYFIAPLSGAIQNLGFKKTGILRRLDNSYQTYIINDSSFKYQTPLDGNIISPRYSQIFRAITLIQTVFLGNWKLMTGGLK